MNIETERKLRDFVSQYVHANVGQMVEYVLNKQHYDGEGTYDAPFCWQDVIEAQNFENLPLADIIEHLEYAAGDIDDSEFEDALEEALSEEAMSIIVGICDEEFQNPWDTFTEWASDNPEAAEENVDTVPLARLAEQHTHPEVYEWWIVNHWFARKLSEHGEIVIDGNIWGRQCTGQSIALDGVVRSIYNEINKDEQVEDE